MYSALFYKEWSKTRMVIALLAVVFTAFIVYTFINTGMMFRVSGAVQVWNGIITKDMPLAPSLMRWLPPLAGIIVALAQFVPEMTDKRLKLTLHLPMPEGRIISAMLVYGVCVLALLFLLTYAALAAGFAAYYPREIIAGMVWLSLPWFLGGMCGYLMAAWICFEPVWRQRILNSLAGVCLLSLFYIDALSGAYKPFVPYLIVFTILSFAFPFFSAARFKEGAQ